MQLSLFDANSERTLRQEELVDTWVKHKCRGTLLCPTGFIRNLTIFNYK